MQVHNYAVGQTMFALNGWGLGGQFQDVGIGNSPGQNPDWTFAENATNYMSKKLEIYVMTGDATALGAKIFYNNSAWDGNDPTANAKDDNAIATDKTPLLPGGSATFANYTSYSKGINGIMIDVEALPTTPRTSDFTFKVGNDNNPAAWATAPAPTIALRRAAGVNQSDRLVLIWPDNAIEKEWLQVTMLANLRTGLNRPYVFYFGNAIGETGDVPGKADVLVNDALRILSNLATGVQISNPFDIDRDGKVLVNDALATLNNLVAGSPALQWIDLTGFSPSSFDNTLPQALSGEVRIASMLPGGSIDPGGAIPQPDELPLRITLDELNHLVLEVPRLPGVSHRLEATTAIGSQPWLQLDLPAGNAMNKADRWILPIDPESLQRFFRVVQSTGAQETPNSRLLVLPDNTNPARPAK
jgi:hypothetical protein